MRDEILKLVRLGTLPSGEGVDMELLKYVQELITKIEAPISDQEAEEMVKIFGDDDCFGLSWTAIHLIETAPNWPIRRCLLVNPNNKWIALLRKRAVFPNQT
jgi:hypothetical protein